MSSSNQEPRRLSFFTMAERADAVRAEAANMAEPVGTGYSLDGEYGGIAPGQLGVILARTKVGKTTFLMNVIANTPAVPTVFFSLEMPLIDLDEWLIGISYDVETPVRAMRRVFKNPEHQHYDELNSALDSLRGRYPHYLPVEAASVPSLYELQDTVDRIEMVTKVRPVRVIIDHVSLMGGGRDYGELTQLTAALHTWAANEGLVVMFTQQTNRGSLQDGRNNGHLEPQLGDGLFAGEHDADWLWGLWQPQKDPIFQKQRHEFKKQEEYEAVQERYAAVKDKTMLKVVTCRRDSKLNDRAIPMKFEHDSYRLVEGR